VLRSSLECVDHYGGNKHGVPFPALMHALMSVPTCRSRARGMEGVVRLLRLGAQAGATADHLPQFCTRVLVHPLPPTRLMKDYLIKALSAREIASRRTQVRALQLRSMKAWLVASRTVLAVNPWRGSQLAKFPVAANRPMDRTGA